jgi:hypothetical protein
MYQNETTNKFSREIALEHVLLQLNTNEDKGHCFEMRTEQNIYYCGCKRIRNRVRQKPKKVISTRNIFFFLEI